MIENAVKILKEGGVVAYPTETYYGLGVNPLDYKALENLRRLKGREEGKPFTLLVADRKTLTQHIPQIPKNAAILMDRYWPGPLTIVLRTGKFSPAVTSPSNGVGFRVSSHPLATKLVAASGGLLTATSANPSGTSPHRTADAVKRAFSGRDLYVLDGGDTHGGLPSTVVDFSSSDKPLLIREGPISWKEIQELWHK